MIFGAFERMVALRYLRARRHEGFISVIAVFSFLGIALGVATLIIVMAVMNGFRQELMARILGVNGHLTVSAYEGPLDDYDALAKRLAGIDGVVSATPQIQGQVMVTANGMARGAIVRAMRAEDLAHRPLLADSIVAGDLADFTGTDAAMIGTRLARTLGVGVGDRIRLVSPSGTTTVIGSVPRIKRFRVVALFQVGMSEYDSNFIYLPLEAGQLFFRMRDQASAIEVFVDDPDRTADIRWQIGETIGRRYQALDWQQANSSFFTAIQVERNVMFLILSLIILVAAFNILSGQYMLVKSKGRDIAILRTMGATRAMVMRIFFLTGALIGVVGTMMGFALGLAFTDNIELIRQWLQGLTGTELFSAEIYFLSRLPAEVDVVEVVQVMAMALFWSFLAPLFPAWQAARLDPVDALRYE